MPQPDIAIVGAGPSGLSLAGILEKNGISYEVFEKYERDTVPRGGCLDLHAGSGQAVMQEAGCTKVFRTYARSGPATIHKVYNSKGNMVFSWGEGLDKPEIGRFEVKKALLSVVPDQKIHWAVEVTEAKRDTSGKIVLCLSDGSTATGYKLVVGADGIWSKIRPLITDVKPKYSGIAALTGFINLDNPHYPEVRAFAGEGPMIVMGHGHGIWNQMQGDGHYRIDLMSLVPADFDGLDIKDRDAVRRVLLEDKFYGLFWDGLKDMIKAVEGPFRIWPLYYIPPERINWKPSPDVTIIGDAAHATIPFVGEGANCAMRDAVILVRKIKEMGIGGSAIDAFEKEMQPYVRDVIERSNISGSLYFHVNSPEAFIEYLATHDLFEGADEVVRHKVVL